MFDHLDATEIFAIVAIGAAMVGFIYWRIRRSWKARTKIKARPSGLWPH